MGVECREDADLNATIHWFGDGASQSAPENDGSRSIPNRRIMEDYGGLWRLMKIGYTMVYTVYP
jgi:hypothetical protein